MVVVDELELGPPGRPVCWSLGGGVPIGGAALGFWAFSQVSKAPGVTTCTVERISEWPAPHSSVHSTG